MIHEPASGSRPGSGFDHVIVALVHVSGYEHLAGPGRSDRAVRRYLTEWAQAGHARQLVRLALDAYDRMIGLNLGGRPLAG